MEEPGGFALGAGVSGKGRCSSERGPRRTSPRPARGEARRPRPSHSRPAGGGERRGQAHGTRLPVRAAEAGWGRGAGAADPLPRRPRGVHEPAGLLLRWDPPWVSHQEQPGSRGSTRPRSGVGRGRTARPGRGAAQTGRPGRAPRTVNRPRPPRGLGLRELHSARGSPGGVGTCDGTGVTRGQVASLCSRYTRKHRETCTRPLPTPRVSRHSRSREGDAGGTPAGIQAGRADGGEGGSFRARCRPLSRSPLSPSAFPPSSR